ncbi:MAG: phage antirepressor KilAC domain-containing protein [Bifidobacterium sp.]|nr:phage antirepressor KilAC domain-containing protein [Bifidobacteriales bacterium]MCT6900354.1 phage antirepressor KilAC domain-containing protein [Bifidobacterium sp.]
MSTDIIQPFDFKGNQVRTLTFETSDTWWVLSDVAKVLGVQNASDLAKRLDQDERSRFNLGRQGEGWIVNESGLYKIVLRSDKPQAREFQRWVTHDVLPSIRRHGAYMSEDVVERTLSDPDYLIRLATALKDERAARTVAEKQVVELQPKAKALDLLADASGSYSVAEAAKMLSGAGCAMRVKDLADWLSSNGWVYRRDGHWVASQMRVNAGHLMMRAYESTGRLKDGSPFAFAPQVRVTAKGLSLIARHVSQDRLDAVQSKDLRRAA